MNDNVKFCLIYYLNTLVKGARTMSFNINRINPNQTQVFFHDGRFETLTNEELEELMLQMGITQNPNDQDINSLS